MFLCYIDESGTSAIPGNTSHFILLGIAIPIWRWKICDKDISQIKRKYGIENSEIHTGWILRPYIEQNKITDFEMLDFNARRVKVKQLRNKNLLELQRKKQNSYKQVKKNYRLTEPYIHLTYPERLKMIEELVAMIESWGFARIFAECIDKIYFDPSKQSKSVDHRAFEQLINRFSNFLNILNNSNKGEGKDEVFGLIIHDNNETIAKRHTELMREFHKKGTSAVTIEHLIETPLFVNSEFTGMVQIADLCAYIVRRYLENDDGRFIHSILSRADRNQNAIVGVRHFTDPACQCMICEKHKKTNTNNPVII